MPDEAHHLVAVDLGSSNGRIVLGRLRGGLLDQEIVHRFGHAAAWKGGRLRWDWEHIREEIRLGLAKAAEGVKGKGITSISCDAWAVDFGLLDRNGELFYPPVSYRDPRSREIPDGFFDSITPEELVGRVGGGVAPVTTLCQLYVMARDEPEALRKAGTLLLMADLVHHDLCGARATDWTLATCSQMRNLRTGEWDRDFLDAMGIPHHFLPRLIDAPRILARIPEDRAPHPKLAGVPIVSTAGHDTSAASVVAGPFDPGTLFLSAGSYTMLGCVSDKPILPPDPAKSGCTVIGLANKRWGLFAPVPGLWIIQECRRLWYEAGKPYSHEELARQAAAASIDSPVPASDPRFSAPKNMLDEIRRACTDTGLQPPETHGEFAKVVFDGLARSYRDAAAVLSDITGRPINRVHMVSGGSLNAYLCRKIADELGFPVLAGPTEASAIGNLVIQARVMNLIPSEEAAAQVLARSFPRVRYGETPS